MWASPTSPRDTPTSRTYPCPCRSPRPRGYRPRRGSSVAADREAHQARTDAGALFLSPVRFSPLAGFSTERHPRRHFPATAERQDNQAYTDAGASLSGRRELSPRQGDRCRDRPQFLAAPPRERTMRPTRMPGRYTGATGSLRPRRGFAAETALPKHRRWKGQLVLQGCWCAFCAAGSGRSVCPQSAEMAFARFAADRKGKQAYTDDAHMSPPCHAHGHIVLAIAPCE
jgi:hypothetical protein